MTDSKYIMFLSGFAFAMGIWDLCEWGLCPKTITLLVAGLILFICGRKLD